MTMIKIMDFTCKFLDAERLRPIALEVLGKTYIQQRTSWTSIHPVADDDDGYNGILNGMLSTSENSLKTHLDV